MEKIATRGFRHVHKALADPVRVGVLDQLWQGPRSAKELAEGLDLEPDRLYYHLNKLEAAGLIRIGSYRELPGGKSERVYQAVDHEPDAEPSTVEEKREFLVALIEATRLDLLAAMGAGPSGWVGQVSMGRDGLQLARERFQELGERIAAVVDEFRADPGEGELIPTNCLYAIIGRARAKP